MLGSTHAQKHPCWRIVTGAARTARRAPLEPTTPQGSGALTDNARGCRDLTRFDQNGQGRGPGRTARDRRALLRNMFAAATGHEVGTRKAVTADSWLRRPRDRPVSLIEGGPATEPPCTPEKCVNSGTPSKATSGTKPSTLLSDGAPTVVWLQFFVPGGD